MIGIISVIVLVVVVLLALFMIVVYRQKKPNVNQQTNYQAFFTMGFSFIGLGVVLTATINVGFLGFIVLGFVYMIIGLSNKDKWKNKK